MFILYVCSSGEFHTFRLPVPSLWPDILEKVKAAGLNAVSVYTHMGLINPAPGVVDFGGFRALQPLYDAAKAAGIPVLTNVDLTILKDLLVLFSFLFHATPINCFFFPLQVHQCRDYCKGYCPLGHVCSSRSTTHKCYRLESCLARLHSRNYQRHYSQPIYSWRTRDRLSSIYRDFSPMATYLKPFFMYL